MAPLPVVDTHLFYPLLSATFHPRRAPCTSASGHDKKEPQSKPHPELRGRPCCFRPRSPAASRNPPGWPSRMYCGRPGSLEGDALAAGQAQPPPAGAQAAGGRRHRHRHQRRAVASTSVSFFAFCFRSKASISAAGSRWASATTATKPWCRRSPEPLKLKGRVHAAEARATHAHTARQLEVYPARPDDHRRHRGGQPLRRPHRDGDGLRAPCSNAEAPARSQADGVDVIQFDEPAFNVYMAEVKELGRAGAACRHRRPRLHHRGAHLLRLWHQGQYRLEDEPRRRVAAIRGNITGAGRKAASARSRSNAATPASRWSSSRC